MDDGENLIGTTAPPTGGYLHCLEAWKSFDYANGVPYPAHAFGPMQWPVDKGPRPTPLSYAKFLVEEGADFVFQGGPPHFAVPDDADADGFLQDVIRWNRLTSRYNDAARQNGHVGTMAAKFSYDAASKKPVHITFLSVPEECRCWFDPHDSQRILMCRIQYPYRAADGHWWYHREEWTEASWITYQPRHAGDASISGATYLPGYSQSLGDGDGWEIDEVLENPFQVIPITLIKNRAVQGSPLGVGDCWGAFNLMDRIALSLHGEDRSNQKHTDPIQVVKNGLIVNDGPFLPDEPIALNNNRPDGPQAEFELVEPTGVARQWVYKSIDKWEELLYKAVGLSLVDPATLGSKGNITRLALMISYARTVATSDLKRTSYGEAGFCVFFQLMLTGLRNCGAFSQLHGYDDDSDVTCAWPDYFSETDQDLTDITNRTVTQVKNGLLPKARAATRLATVEDIPDSEHEDLLAELDAEDKAKQKRADAAQKALQATQPDAPAAGAGSGSEALGELNDAGNAST